MTEQTEEEKVFDKELLNFLAKMPEYKKKLMEQDLKVGRVTCPRCNTKSLVLSLQGTKHHLWAKCAKCSFRMVE